MSAWFYAKNGQRSGPVSSDELCRLASEGELQPTDLVWSEGMTDWQPARDLDGVDWPQTPPPIATACDPENPASPAKFRVRVKPRQAGYAYEPAQPVTTAPGATASLVWGIIGLFICGPILGCVAISQSNKAKALIRQHPKLYTGNGLATAGFVLGIIDIVGAVIAILIGIAQQS